MDLNGAKLKVKKEKGDLFSVATLEEAQRDLMNHQVLKYKRALEKNDSEIYIYKDEGADCPRSGHQENPALIPLKLENHKLNIYSR